MNKNKMTAKEVSEKVAAGGEWKMWFFQFIDDFRKKPSVNLIIEPPNPELEENQKALLQSIVLFLIHEQKWQTAPDWVNESMFLHEAPWFVSGIENLKAMAIKESPAEFRGNNIFVLNNFMHRV